MKTQWQQNMSRTPWRVLQATFIVVLSIVIPSQALEGPLETLPGTSFFTWDGNQGLGPSEDGNMARSNADGWWVTGNDGVHLQGTSGKTMFIDGVGIADDTAAYWGPSDAASVRLSLQPGAFTASEIMSYNAGESILVNGVLRFQGTTAIQIWSGTAWETNQLPSRWTMTVTSLPGGSPVALVAPGTLGLNSGIGGLVPIASSGVQIKIHTLFEAFTTNVWQPAYDYYNAQQTTNVAGGAQYTFNEGFYYEQPNTEATTVQPISTTQTRITWNNLLNTVGYIVQTKTNLSQATWSTELGFTAVSGTYLTDHSHSGIPKKFYRLRASP